MTYRVTFWGTRGSIPAPGPDTARYGGNTPCLAIEGEDDLVILDAGTGIRALGRVLTERGNGEIQAQILLSHTHWDHIQGLPFFAPFFEKGNKVVIWGAAQGDVSLEVILQRQMDPVVFPVPLGAVAAELEVRHTTPGTFVVGRLTVDAFRVRHPGTALAYRLTPPDHTRSMAYVTDNELGPGGDYKEPPDWRQRFVDFLRGADLLIHDAMYTPEEVKQFPGWGHSSYEEAVAIAQEAGIQRLVLFHHRPEHSDAALDEITDRARRLAEGSDLEVIAAREGLELDL